MKISNTIINSQNSPSFDILLCPYCQVNIPYFFITILKREMFLYIQCPCLKEGKYISYNEFQKLKIQMNESHKSNAQCTKHNTLKAENYCPLCAQSLCKECLDYHSRFSKNHIIINREIPLKCTQHDDVFSHYCKDCNANFCSQCSSCHNKHPLIDISTMKGSLIDIPDIDKFIERNKQYYNKLIAKKEINQFQQIKEDIALVFNETNEINGQIKSLYKILIQTSLILKYTPTYQMRKMINTFKLNTNEFVIDDNQSIESIYNGLKEYLQSNYVISQYIGFLKGHSDDVWGLIQLNDGQLASCSYDDSIKFWSGSEDKPLKLVLYLKDIGSYVRSMIQLIDGCLALGFFNNHISIYDLSTNNCKAQLKGHNGIVWCLTQLKDQRLASGSSDKTIKIWNLTSNKCVKTLIGHNDFVRCIIQLADDRLASCSGYGDASIKLWDISQPTNESKLSLIGHSRWVKCLSQLSNGLLASGSEDKTIKLWDMMTHKCTNTLIGHHHYIKCIIQLQDDRLASASVDKSIRIWSSKTYECILVIDTQSNINCLIQLSDGRLASGSCDHSIRLWLI